MWNPKGTDPYVHSVKTNKKKNCKYHKYLFHHHHKCWFKKIIIHNKYNARIWRNFTTHSIVFIITWIKESNSQEFWNGRITVTMSKNKISCRKKISFRKKKKNFRGEEDPSKSQKNLYMFSSCWTVFVRGDSLLCFGRFSSLHPHPEISVSLPLPPPPPTLLHSPNTKVENLKIVKL